MPYSSASMRAEKRSVAGNSVLAAIAITTLKIVVGFTTGSLGILSEAAHSGLGAAERGCGKGCGRAGTDASYPTAST